MAKPKGDAPLVRGINVNVPLDVLRELGDGGAAHDKAREELCAILSERPPTSWPVMASQMETVRLRVTEAMGEKLAQRVDSTRVQQSEWLRLAFHRAAYGRTTT